jgi:hypothetical protein
LLKCHMALGHLVHAFRSLWTMIDPSWFTWCVGLE